MTGTIQTMPRFVAIDGLRAWMAWTVVASHIVQQALPGGGGPTWITLDLGGHAVDVFIIISGFVITHLLVERPGPYLAYVVPRFMRLFPGFVTCCAIGGLSYAAAAAWAEPAWFEEIHGAAFRSLTHHLPEQTLAHLTMLHGLIPNDILPLSEYAFVPPGWSVSLEWQFYLVAPLALWCFSDRSRAALLVLAVVAFSLLYHHGLKHYWDRPSILIGTSKMFLIGMACRLAAASLAGLNTRVAAIGLGLGFSSFWIGSPSLAIWLLVYSFILKGEGTTDALDGLYVRGVRAMLESGPVLWLAERSYTTYLLHWPVMTLIGVVATRAGVPLGMHLVAIMLLAFPLTLILQEPIYRFVEVPGRELGKRWARRFGARPAREVATEAMMPEPLPRSRLDPAT